MMYKVFSTSDFINGVFTYQKKTFISEDEGEFRRMGGVLTIILFQVVGRNLSNIFPVTG